MADELGSNVPELGPYVGVFRSEAVGRATRLIAPLTCPDFWTTGYPNHQLTNGIAMCIYHHELAVA